MIGGKLLAGLGLAGAGLFATASLTNASTVTLAVVGVLNGIGLTCVGIYTAYRAARTAADIKDQPLIQSRVKMLETELADAVATITNLRSQVQLWKDLYDRSERDRDRGRGPATPQTPQGPPA